MFLHNLHVHTTYSMDSVMDLEETVHTLTKLGYGTAAITEHKYHFMHDPVQYTQYIAEVRTLQKKTKMRLLPGMEICVLENDIDWAPHFVADDFMILASVHEKMPHHDEFLKRTIRTIQDARVHIIGHPLRVLYQSKLPALNEKHMTQIFNALRDEYTKGHMVTLEVNSGDDRRGLTKDAFYQAFYRAAKKRGAKFSLGTDAHEDAELRSIPIKFLQTTGLTEKDFFTPQLS